MDTLVILNLVTWSAAIGAIAVLLRRSRRDNADAERFEKTNTKPHASCELAGSTHTYR
ncbi:hypothetical protein ABXK61_16245 [Burkholderia sola]|uniref:hypothetical protein n=1 Tax=Burkholderia TaxID=32008 RepID=UPI001AE2FCA8|nr:hypothetical protein [Burkholderia sp. AcTa6-5]MBP0714856.1 hypothetical protein [Burkholderia sp. AcTa6-5]